MRTAIVSDLHIGTAAGVDLARRPDILARLVDAIAGSDRLVLLGDLLELRDRPVEAVLAAAADPLAAIGEAMAGGEIVLVPGNHDHQLAAAALERGRRRDSTGPLSLETHLPVEPSDLVGELAALTGHDRVRLAYPGIWLRPDVYATHGHFLDVHLSVPRPECLAAAALARVGGRGRPRDSVDAYEAVLAPLYAFSYASAQYAPERTLKSRGNLSRRAWQAANPEPGRRRSASAMVFGRVAMPAAVGGLNALGFGPFSADLSAVELRRAGLRAIAEVVAGLAIDAEHVIFGHTHRAGPLPGDARAEWMLPSGAQLTNCGSWVREPALLRGGDAPSSPYWPGRVALLDDEGPPRLISTLDADVL